MSFPAHKTGRCALCRRLIRVGDLIRRVPGLPRNRHGYSHERCLEDVVDG